MIVGDKVFKYLTQMIPIFVETETMCKEPDILSLLSVCFSSLDTSINICVHVLMCMCSSLVHTYTCVSAVAARGQPVMLFLLCHFVSSTFPLAWHFLTRLGCLLREASGVRQFYSPRCRITMEATVPDFTY